MYQTSAENSKKVHIYKILLHKIQCIISVSFYRKLPPPHGGDDPGKIGVNQVLEKDINLSIARKVKQYLEAQDIRVVMTREDENGLYDSDVFNKKVQDMKRRVALIEEAKPAITVSIHQNSYPEEYVHGAQVFYYDGSRDGQLLADLLQRQLVEKLDPENHRQIKANDSYYLLKKTDIPIVIVEYCVSDRQTDL